ncbi:Hsp70 family protein [Limimaricola pyoseonensis]|uniref:Hypothetical chaperone protein n=1 Tax=Limimaricola pyoseonensis TaxID=521013 RepID=A0A1G7KEJ0_9RHOB|nr:Hsp70 family protein [Limimaricola pyoseonensis]SDF35269.1 hypothetical chaperone protein [Limimaricola pyoseonensis]
MTPTACGIDFGTSNSTLGLGHADGGRLIALEGGEATLPSAVFWEVDDPEPIFGRAAIAAYADGEDGRLLRGLKSTLGSSLIHERTAIGRRAVSFREILGRFFGHMRDRLDAVAPGVERAVLGRPVHFVDGDAEGDRAAEDVLAEIARAAGFSDISFQYEPIAAALHYESGIAAEELVLIVDIGGGTSDFSIVRVSPERARVADRAADILANDGIRVGGTDLDRLLSLSQAMPHLGLDSPIRGGKGAMPRHYYVDLATWHRINRLYTGKALSDLKALRREADRPELVERMLCAVEDRRGHALAMAVEGVKIALTAEEAARLELKPLVGGPNPVVARAAFEEAVAAPLDRISDSMASVLAQAGLEAGAIGTVFMTGGSSHIPALRARVAARFPGARIATGDMLGSVGTGLALEAGRRFG